MSPRWFRDAVARLKAAGLLANIELSTHDLDAQWQRYGSERRGAAMAATIAGHRSRSCTLHDWRVNDSRWLRRLDDITGGRDALRFARTGSGVARRLRVSSIDETLTITPAIELWIDELAECFDPRQLLGAINQCATGGQFCTIGDRAVFLSPGEREAVASEGVEVDEPAGTRWDRAGAGGEIRVELAHEVLADGARLAYLPILAPGGDGPCEVGGQPWGELPPECRACGELSVPLFQARLDWLPLGLQRLETVQIYVCCGIASGRFDRRTSGLLPGDELEDEDCLPGSTIIGWRRIEDQRSRPHSGAKCGGWPVLEHRCSSCRRDAALLFQVPGLGAGEVALSIFMCDECRRVDCAGARIEPAMVRRLISLL